jgi:tetratricopeptide (TPR) repeat protein
MARHRKWVPSAATWLLTGLSLCAQVVPSASVSQLKQKAAKAESDGNTERAIRLYAEVLGKTPEWTEGLWEYGKLLYDSRRFADAAQAFGRLTRLAPDNPLGFALLGLCEYEEGDWNNASLHLNKALAGRKGLPAPISQSAAYHLGLVLMRQRNGEGALLAFRILFHQAPDYPGLRLAFGSAQLNLEQVPAADSPLLPAARMAGEAAIAILQVRKKDAEDSYRALIAQFPTQPCVHLDYGMFLESEHRDEEATAEFLAETKTNPDSAAPWLWLGRLALERRDGARAREDALRARKLNPDDALSFLIEGRSFILDRQWDNALSPLREAEQRAPQSSEVHYALVSVYMGLHRNGDAEQERQLFLQTSKFEDER